MAKRHVVRYNMDNSTGTGCAIMAIGYFIAVFSIWALAIIGWIANIVRLTGCSFDPLTGETVLRLIGVFLGPVGSVLGFIGHWN